MDENEGRSINWSVESEEKLVDLWEERPCLYDISCKEYSNRDIKRKALDDIGAALSMPGNLDCILMSTVIGLLINLNSNRMFDTRQGRRQGSRSGGGGQMLSDVGTRPLLQDVVFLSALNCRYGE
jgi:hypothetical protein